MARRKVVFIIVEGASDETALGIALNQVFDKESVHVHMIIPVIQEADRQCGSCGCEFDPLYKRALELL